LSGIIAYYKKAAEDKVDPIFSGVNQTMTLEDLIEPSIPVDTCKLITEGVEETADKISIVEYVINLRGKAEAGD
jgi:hypothetical protein